MLKLIQFIDTRAIWSDIPNHVEGFACRTVKNLDVLPTDIMLEFNCKESELSSVSHDRNQLYLKAKNHRIPEINLILK